MATQTQQTNDGRDAEAGRLSQADLEAMMPVRSAGREVKVGAFVILGVIAFFTVLFTMTDVGTFRGRYYTSAIVPDAGGMRAGDPIQMRGVNIGRVKGFEMRPDGVALALELYDRYPVPEDSRVQVSSSGLLGGMVVNVIPGTAEDRADEDDVLLGSVDRGVSGAVSTLGERADTTLTRVNELLSRRTVGAVGESVTELQALLTELNALAARQRTELAALSGSLRRSAAGVERVTTGPELERAIANVDSLTQRLDGVTADLGRASASLETVLGRMERGEGTLGKLSADDELYLNLNSAVANLDALVQDFKANPKKYIDVSVF